MTIFVDTSAFLAVLDGDEINHPRATASWRVLLNEGSNLLTTSYVLLETAALIQKRLGLTAVRVFHEDVYPLLQIVWTTKAEHESAMDAMLTFSRRKLSLVDCVSFHVMRAHGVRTAFCFDAHFREQGFTVKP